MQKQSMLLSVNTWTMSQPRPFLLCPSPVKCTLALFSWCLSAWRLWEKTVLCSLGHSSQVLLALFMRVSDMSASLHINWPLRHVPWLPYFATDLSTCLFPPRSNVHCASIFQWIKKDLPGDPQQRSLHPHGNWKLPSRSGMSFKKNFKKIKIKIKIKKEIKFIDYK